MAYTNMTGEKLDSVDEREADALMQTVLPSLASKDFRSMGELDLNLLALGRQPVFIELAGTFKRGFFIPFDTVVKKQVEQWKASFKA